jgi:hypothetical protein
VAWGFLSPLIEPDVRISRIRLSDWFHVKAPRRIDVVSWVERQR